MENEIWMKIKGYNYSISNFYRIRNNKNNYIMKHVDRGNGYKNVSLSNNGISKNFLVHRLIAIYFINNPLNKKCVDHIDNNRSNNVISNLRWVTYKENKQNTPLPKNSSTGFKGVYFIEKSKKWRARIKINNKLLHLGCFNSLNEAVYARKRKANEIYGEYCNKCEKL